MVLGMVLLDASKPRASSLKLGTASGLGRGGREAGREGLCANLVCLGPQAEPECHQASGLLGPWALPNRALQVMPWCSGSTVFHCWAVQQVASAAVQALVLTKLTTISQMKLLIA